MHGGDIRWWRMRGVASDFIFLVLHFEEFLESIPLIEGMTSGIVVVENVFMFFWQISFFS